MTTKNQSLVEKGFASYLPIALTAIIFAAVPGGLLGSMSIFFTHLAEDNMTVVSQVTIYLTAGALVLAFSGPIMGRLFAQYDLRIVGSVIVILIALSMFVLSINTSIVQVWIAGALMHFLCLLGMGLLLPTLINRWFKDRAGAVLGLAAAFTGVGGAIFIQVGQAIIDASDYRTALLVYAVLCLVLTLPFMLFAIRSFPEEKGMLPYISSKHSDQTGSASSAVAAKNWSVDPSIATKSIPFVLVCVIVACANWTTQIASFFPTYINSLTAVGVTTFVTGATLATFTMVGQAICKVILGASVDFSPIKAVFAACGIGIVAILCVWLSPGSLLLPIGGFILVCSMQHRLF